MESWPEDILQFAWIQDLDHKLNDLANKAEHEDWSYQNTPSEHEKPILYNYIRYTYRKVAEERKITVSEDAQFACFNTGLVTPSQEPLFASFEINRYPDRQRWYFKEWFYRGERQLNVFPELPDLANYFDDPTCLVFDARKDFRLNTEHIVQQTPALPAFVWAGFRGLGTAGLRGGVLYTDRPNPFQPSVRWCWRRWVWLH